MPPRHGGGPERVVDGYGPDAEILAQCPERARCVSDGMVLNLGLFEELTVEYLNGDRFDLRAANLHLVDV